MWAIGVFDSGYGGLTVLGKIREQLPEYDYIYLWDNARAPYGTRSFEMVYKYTREGVQTLFGLGCDLVILACNTASAKALRVIQQQNLPQLETEKKVLGVIRPTAETIGTITISNHVWLLATSGTVQSRSYDEEIQHFFPDVILTSEACPMRVPLIENNQYQTPWAEYFIREHVEHLLKSDPQIDTLILWCTHYPLIQDQIQNIVWNNITVLAQGDIVAKSLKDYLVRHSEVEERCSKQWICQYFTTESVKKFESSALVFLDESIVAEYIDVF